jgi:iron complex transport system ATP-binding protein
MEGPALLQTTRLAVGYGGKTVLDGLNLVLTAGQFVCFMGPNGIGKSTLIRTLAGLQSPLHGTISFVNEQKPAVVLTDRISASYMTVRQLITFGRYPYLGWNLRLSPADHHAIDTAITQLKLHALSEQRLHELSDGQLQLAQIARALAQETSLIFLDEPTAHLDLNNRLEITLLLRRLAHDSGKAVLMATHELDLALQTADKVWLAGNGTEMLSGPPEDLVLNGSFDDIFKLKGFDLRTGKVQHIPDRRYTVAVEGEGPASLWTRNALERCGYRIVTTDADRVVQLQESNGRPCWKLADGRVLASIAELLSALAEL